jgi:hypothetical protein
MVSWEEAQSDERGLLAPAAKNGPFQPELASARYGERTVNALACLGARQNLASAEAKRSSTEESTQVGRSRSERSQRNRKGLRIEYRGFVCSGLTSLVSDDFSSLSGAGFEGACLPVDRGKTVTKPLALSRLGLPLSEKQIPQVVENLESGGKSREALETA